MDEQKVFLRDEVITLDDLKAIRNGYVYSYQIEPDDLDKYKFLVAVGVLESIIEYLKRGKTSKEIPQ